MDDLLSLLLKPVLIVFLWLFRLVFFVVVEVVHEYITWAVGWCFLRLLSFGKYPKQGIWSDQRASVATSVLVSLTGALLITLLIIGLLIL